MSFVVFVKQFVFYPSGEKQFLSLVEKQLLTKDCGLLTVATPNPEQLVQTWEDPKFAQTLKKFDYLLPDGVGLVWLSKWSNKLKTLQEKVAGIDVTHDLLALAFKHNWRVLIIGGRDYQGTKIAINDKNFESKGLLINAVDQSTNFDRFKLGGHSDQIFWLAGYRDVSQPTLAEKKQLVFTLQKLQPHLVFVAFGAPRQEFWIQENLTLLKKYGARLVMTVGGSFDILTGKLPRAPKLLRQLGLEWLWRLWLQPTRINRQLKLIKFAWLSLIN